MAVTDKQINELEEFFNSAQLPASVQLDPGSKIDEVSKFVNSHLKVLRNNGNKPLTDVFYIRLIRLKEIINDKL